MAPNAVRMPHGVSLLSDTPVVTLSRGRDVSIRTVTDVPGSFHKRPDKNIVV